MDEILAYLEERSPAAAQRLAAAIDAQCELLSHVPLKGRPRDDLASGLRSVVVEKYLLFYRVTDAAVLVLRILHGRRDIDSIMKDDDDGE